MTPAYGGWLLGSLAIFFFLAAANTLAGWLYVMSGVSLSLLVVAAVLPARSLLGIAISRQTIYPVSAGDSLTIALAIANRTGQPKSLLQVQDLVPQGLGRPVQTVVEDIPAHGVYDWTYSQPTRQRGIYRWQTVYLRTAAPLGLFWCRRSRQVSAKAIVYPSVLSLTRCPLIDQTGQELTSRLQSHSSRSQMATEGSTRSLRPYRWGDPTRLVHWRTSARYGELRVRELEILTGGQGIVIGLDSAFSWQQASPESNSRFSGAAEAFSDDFEQAVIAAASLYFYARHNHLNVQLWTAGTGLLQGDQTVLEALAQVNFDEMPQHQLPQLPLVWLTQNLSSLSSLPPRSRWVLWASHSRGQRAAADNQPEQGDRLNRKSEKPASLINRTFSGLTIQPDQPLQTQLQSPPS